MGAEAKSYLHEHSIPQLFEGLMTGLIYNRPADPYEFLESAIKQVKMNPEKALTWDMFIDKGITTAEKREIASKRLGRSHGNTAAREDRSTAVNKAREASTDNSEEPPKTAASRRGESRMGLQRTPSVIKAAEVAEIPDVPIILFMGGPGGGKTRHAARVFDSLADRGLVHICMPDVIRKALSKYKDKYSEWKEANEHYMRGELIPNHLALALVKAEMGRHKSASAFFLEGFPREARQVEDFERQVKSVNMALIIDYDERTLRDHMEKRGLGMELIDQKIKEFKQKTLPSAKYFDDQKLLHLIPGEKDDQTIYERMRGLVMKAMDSGVPVLNSSLPSTANGPPAISVSATKSPSPPPPPAVLASSVPVELPPIATEVEKPATPPKPPAEPSSTELPPIQSRPSTNQATVPAVVPVAAPVTEKPATSQETRVEASEEENKPPQTTASVQDTPEVSVNLPKGLPNSAPVILIVGAPGSEKSEVAKRISQKYDGFVLLSMGNLLRKKTMEMKDDELWQRISQKMAQGESVPMKLCRELLYSEMHRIGQTSWGYVIEGFPRTQAQVNDLENVIERIDLVVLIDCTEQFCEESASKRFAQNSTDRPDNTPEVFKLRLIAFKQNTLPMLKYLDENRKLRVVDGDADVDTIFKEVCQVIDSELYTGEEDGSGHSLDESKKGSLE